MVFCHYDKDSHLFGLDTKKSSVWNNVTQSLYPLLWQEWPLKSGRSAMTWNCYLSCFHMCPIGDELVDGLRKSIDMCRVWILSFRKARLLLHISGKTLRWYRWCCTFMVPQIITRGAMKWYKMAPHTMSNSTVSLHNILCVVWSCKTIIHCWPYVNPTKLHQFFF